tara:strand:+ start:572 stop:748 length:177 start_codon:yes stop_codon:yes gene_type:complete
MVSWLQEVRGDFRQIYIGEVTLCYFNMLFVTLSNFASGNGASPNASPKPLPPFYFRKL